MGKKCTCGKTQDQNGNCDGSHNQDCNDQDLDQNEDVPFADKIKIDNI